MNLRYWQGYSPAHNGTTFDAWMPMQAAERGRYYAVDRTLERRYAAEAVAGEKPDAGRSTLGHLQTHLSHVETHRRA